MNNLQQTQFRSDWIREQQKAQSQLDQEKRAKKRLEKNPSPQMVQWDINNHEEK